MSSKEPPQETFDDSKEYRLRLLEEIKTWLSRPKEIGRHDQPAKRSQIETYIDVSHLRLSKNDQFSLLWRRKIADHSYESCRHAFLPELDSQVLPDLTTLKRLVEPHIFLHGSLNEEDVRLITSKEPESLHHVTDWTGKLVKHTEKKWKRIAREVGVAILHWILRDERFTSDPLPSFKTPDHRINWFDQVLQEQPLLYAIFIYGPFPQTIHLQYLYSSEVEWNDTGKQVRELISYRVPRILDLIFRGMFNMPQANNQFQFFTEKGRKWVVEEIPKLFQMSKQFYPVLRTEDIPVWSWWPQPGDTNRPWKVDKQEEHDTSEDGEEKHVGSNKRITLSGSNGRKLERKKYSTLEDKLKQGYTGSSEGVVLEGRMTRKGRPDKRFKLATPGDQVGQHNTQSDEVTLPGGSLWIAANLDLLSNYQVLGDPSGQRNAKSSEGGSPSASMTNTQHPDAGKGYDI